MENGLETGAIPVADPSADAEDAQPTREELLLKKKHFPFMELPSELRLNIYRMALCRPKPILLHMPKPAAKESDERDEYEVSELWDGDNPVTLGLPPRPGRRPSSPRAPRPGGRTFARRFEVKQQLPHNVNTEPLVPALLRVSQQIYREARPVLYSDNELVLHLPSALCTLNGLHQRSRSLIKHVHLTIPTHHDILEGFADLVRLGLRYCWGLKTFTITLPDMFPEERSVPSSTTNVYANAFHILRWLPKATVVRLEGNVQEEIRKVVEENGRLAMALNEVKYLRRQHQMPERR
ncbi:uncharacterized protein K452DRAFT_235476 [Aplosporella prunicola CBS 121167]|uniref:2EXR domain-containing protein n=1 Tax=Aplosporella prunicola CBS 121167 TaxID=1176127 RepID=A0A6A6B2Z0_9PEZI|nr:uncharacterized protein K452DRAFT_235476 [Aplosporella prunicola CBS 121167]KAF2137615.1 hypothetical protein K452DRAFT_235476 [Aplosporella prunicola CBS 121167]